MMSFPRREPSVVAHLSAQERALQELQARIGEGRYRYGSLLPTERQLSEEIGISRPVVRAALQQLQDEGWITREPGCRPRVSYLSSSADAAITAASGVASTTLKAIATVMPMEGMHPAAYNIQRGIQRTLQSQASDFRLVVFDSLGGVLPSDAAALNPEIERQILTQIAEEGIAGVILWHIGGEETLTAITALQKRGVPLVFVDRFPASPTAPACDFVGADNRTGARDAVRYLIEQGHRWIAHLTFAGQCLEGEATPVRERNEGYRDALRESGLPFSGQLVGGSASILQQIKASGPDAPTAVFAVNDASAHHFIELAQAEGIRIPEDVSVIGFDDLDRYSHRSPYLTSVYLPFDTIGERAAELLLSRLKHPLAPHEPVQHTLLPTALMVRATCTSPAKGEIGNASLSVLAAAAP